MDRIFSPPIDTRSPARQVIDQIVLRAVETDAKTTEQLAATLRMMEQAFTESQAQFWRGAVPASDLVAELGNKASQFFSESYLYAERLHAMGSQLFVIRDAQGNDASRNEQGHLIAALPPVQVVHNQDGTVTIK